MSYTARSVSFEDVRNGVFLTQGNTMPSSRKITGTTAEEVYKITIDFTNIDYIRYNFTANSVANLTDIEIKIGGTSKKDLNNTADGGNLNGDIDCTAISGELALTIEINNTGASTSHLTDVSIVTREA